MALVKFPVNITLEKAWSIIEQRVSPNSRTVSLDLLKDGSALGRILSDDIFSNYNLPHYPASAVDGFAINSNDTVRASSTLPKRIPEGAYSWVNTGGSVERSFDSVVMVEDTAMDENTLLVTRTLSPGSNIRPEGEDVVKGQIVVRKGERLSFLNIPLLIASGVSRVSVREFPRTIFIPTGDEIVPAARWIADCDKKGDQAPETNSIMLQGLFREWGYPLDVSELFPDDPELIGNALERSISSYDLVLIGAGTAKGKRDHSIEVIQRSAEIIFRGIRMKPGRPVILGISGNTPVVALPGFPMSALVSAWTVVFPILNRLYGKTPNVDLSEAIGCQQIIETRLLKHHSSQQGVAEWLRVKCGEIRGRKYSWPLASGASSMFSMAESDGFALLDDSTLELPKESHLRVWIKNEFEWEKRIVYQGSNDPAIERLVSFIRDRGGDMAIRSVGSLGGLAAISRGEGHIASCHLLDPENGTYNDSYIEAFSGSENWKRIKLFRREQGFLVQKGNPRGIFSATDLLKKGTLFLNRQPGAGTRVLFDHLLRESEIEPASIKGYHSLAVTHFEASARVSNGSADATLGIKAAADAFGNDFVPVAEEEFELVIPECFLGHPGIVILLETIQDKNWRSVVDRLGGYTWVNLKTNLAGI